MAAATAAVTVAPAAVAVAPAAPAAVADEALVGIAQDVTAATVTLHGNSIRPQILPQNIPESTI